MVHTSHLITYKEDSQTVMRQVVEALTDAGFQVVQSFDLQVARAAHSQCTCPHHGSARCDCQMIVLLVYIHKDQPVTLIAHGQDGVTYLGLLNASSREETAQLEAVLLRTLEDNKLGARNERLWSNAT